MKMLVCDISLIGITISINSSVQVIWMNMESVKLQLELGPKAITVRSSLWEGVLASKTFEGHNCYTQFLDFIKQAYPDEKIISATIAVSNNDWWFSGLVCSERLSLQSIYMYDKSWYINNECVRQAQKGLHRLVWGLQWGFRYSMGREHASRPERAQGKGYWVLDHRQKIK